MTYRGDPADRKEITKQRKKYFFDLAESLGVDKKFVQKLFAQEARKIVGVRFDIGSKIRVKAGVKYGIKTPDRPITPPPVRKKRAKIEPKKVQCIARTSPQCLDIFITNKNDPSYTCLKCIIAQKEQQKTRVS